ncbi:uncharacterized protein BXIN_2667 [Babesia sp. Xinjiang]|uniref:uncharacterized protein n=1 Tax=Babesia sp. Xinjiang TaxID=462227 RepID=UPI000A23AEB6|nr:uncharacterized protein BXIN_2667 [Babesia sp. Xinjiang]ORM41631.1 hypothetical protein BXIN_2667 [Babesia sp. Xinjiang]
MQQNSQTSTVGDTHPVSQCRHITYIQTNFIAHVLKLQESEVVNQHAHRCYIPTCQGNDMEQLKAFFQMGYPPIKTYHPINYIGIGIHNTQTVDTTTKREKTVTDEGKRNVFRLPLKSKGDIDKNKYIFATPSCMYATLPEMASAINFDELQVNLRIVIEVLVKPGSYTQAASSLHNLDNNFDCCFPNENIEWFIDNVEHIIPKRILFRILKKETPTQVNATPSSSTPVAACEAKPKTNGVDLITVAPPSAITFVTDNNFQALRSVYSSTANAVDAVTFLERANDTSEATTPKAYASRMRSDTDKPNKTDTNGNNEVIALKLKWTEHNNKVVYYLKMLVGSKWLEWDSEFKLWCVKTIFIYECVKFAAFLGLRINDRVLFRLWSWLRSIDMRGIGEVFSKVHLLDWLNTNKIWLFQRIELRVIPGFNPDIHRDIGKGTTPAVQAAAREAAETVEVALIPFNKDIVARFKERNASNALNSSTQTYVWNKISACWQTAQLRIALEDLMTVLPNIREANQGDTYLSSRGINLRDIKREHRKKSDRVNLNVPLKRQREPKDDDSDTESEFATVTKLLITAAGKEPHLMRVREKIKNVVEKVAPPSSSISASGKVVLGGAGTGGIEFVEAPRGTEAWNKISLCVVPNEHDGEVPVDTYDPHLLASLVGEVFLVKEAAIDYLLANFKRWPGPHDSIGYTRWTDVLTRHEARCWGDLSFDSRQHLAQSRLFCDEDFFVSGSGEGGDSALCSLLVELGNGKLVSDPSDAEYVVITDRKSEEALELKRKFADNDEDLISKTHGARHSTLVTPKFIYDCILTWRLQRPTKSQGHMAF